MKIHLDIEVPGRYSLANHTAQLRQTAQALVDEAAAIEAASALNPLASLHFDGHTWDAGLALAGDGLSWSLGSTADTPKEAVQLVNSLVMERAIFCGLALLPDFRVLSCSSAGLFHGKLVRWVDQDQFAGDFDEDDLAALEDLGFEIEVTSRQNFQIVRDRYSIGQPTRPGVVHGRAA